MCGNVSLFGDIFYVIQIYESVPEIEGKDCSKEDDEVAEELDSDAQPPVGHVADQNVIMDGIFNWSAWSSSLYFSFNLFLPPDVVAVKVGGHPCLVLREESLLLVESSDGGCALHRQTVEMDSKSLDDSLIC